MQGKREMVVSTLDRMGAFSMLLRGRALTRAPVLTILAYHRVMATGTNHPFNEGVIDASPEQFERQMKTLQRYCNVVTLDEAVDAIAAAQHSGHGWRDCELPPNPVLVTFDDGYRTCLDPVLPILNSFGFKATFFIPTDYINQRRVPWWDRISYVIHQTNVGTIELTYPHPITIDLADKDQAADILIGLVRNTDLMHVGRFLTHVTATCEVDWSRDLETELCDQLLMSWEDIRRLRDQGMYIESHTRTHRILQTLDSDDLKSELTGSRAELEAVMGSKPRTIAYPVGMAIENRPEICSAVASAGYSVGFSMTSGVNYMWRAPYQYNIRRIAMDANMSPRFFRGILAVPRLAHNPSH